MRLVKAVIAFAVLFFFCTLFWFRFGQFQTSELSRSFYIELRNSKTSTFDLRKIDAVDWDEIVFWSPYTNICDFGIEGLEKGSPDCKSSGDDGECYLLFLKQNKLAGTVPVDRSKIDLTTAELKERVAKEKAVFRFVTTSFGPKIQLVK